jgi:hypothetical protein
MCWRAMLNSESLADHAAAIQTAWVVLQVEFSVTACILQQYYIGMIALSSPVTSTIHTAFFIAQWSL